MSDARPSCVLAGPSISSVTSSLLSELNEDKLLELEDEEEEEELLELEDEDDELLEEDEDELLELEEEDLELRLL